MQYRHSGRYDLLPSMSDGVALRTRRDGCPAGSAVRTGPQQRDLGAQEAQEAQEDFAPDRSVHHVARASATCAHPSRNGREFSRQLPGSGNRSRRSGSMPRDISG